MLSKASLTFRYVFYPILGIKDIKSTIIVVPAVTDYQTGNLEYLEYVLRAPVPRVFYV